MSPPLSIRGSCLDIGRIWDDQIKQLDSLLSEVGSKDMGDWID